MTRKIILSAAAVTMIFVSAASAQQYQHNRKTAREINQKNVRCHAAIDPKGLKGRGLQGRVEQVLGES